MAIRLVSIALALFLTACASSPKVQFYVLKPLATLPSASVEIKGQQSIGIGPISLPSLLENKNIVTRLSDNTVQVAQFHQWAAPLQDHLLQTISRNLTVLQPDAAVRTYPWSVHGTVDFQIIIDISRFDASPGKSVNLEANWTIKNEKTNIVYKNGRSIINHPLRDTSYLGSVHALSQILGEFSQVLSLALTKIAAAN